MVDIVVLCDIEESVVELQDVFFYGIDDLCQVIDYNCCLCEVVVCEVDVIIDLQVECYMVWCCMLGVCNLVVDMCYYVEVYCDEVLEKVCGMFVCGKLLDEVFVFLVNMFINKLLYYFSVVLCEVVFSGDLDLLYVVGWLYGLDCEIGEGQ